MTKHRDGGSGKESKTVLELKLKKDGYGFTYLEPKI